MILTQYKSLWNKIQNFSFDDPDAVITFSRKLASQNNWSAKFTERVIEEYRKFTFLCCVSPQGASPSEIVDEAWHLHLTYTQSYWISFCKNTLDKDIHHYPSKGGADEKIKHEIWYEETLKFYTEVFETIPPSDIWPPLIKDADNFPDLPVPVPSYSNLTKAAITVLLIIPFLFIFINFHTLNPYSLSGPEFLWFFSLIGIAAVVIFAIFLNVKGKALKKDLNSYFPDDVTIFQLAKFLYGKHRAVQTGIVDLIRRSMLELQGKNKFLIKSNSYYDSPLEKNPLLSELNKEKVGSIVEYTTIADYWYNKNSFSHPALERLYRLHFRKESFLKKYLPIIIVALIGLIRLLQGWLNDKPVDYLLFEMGVLVIATMIVYYTSSLHSVVFKEAKAIYNIRISNGKYYDDAVVSDFVVRGGDSLYGFREGLLLAAMFSAYPPLTHAKDTSGGGCSSCSGSTGGGCGGGCGGCGGGGGD